MSERLQIHRCNSTTCSLIPNKSKLLNKNLKPLMQLHQLVQTKLAINQPGDQHEQEADRVAEKVMRMSDPVLQRKCPKKNEDNEEVLQPKGLTGKAQLTQRQDVPPIVHDVLHSPGKSLDAITLAFMEQRLGYDFSKVRVHTDAKAAKSARAVNSLAYTVGHDIIFGTEQYAPSTNFGKKLLVHELTHVVQQSAGAKGIQARLDISHPDDPAEYEAERISKAAMQGEILPTSLSQKIQVARDTPDAGSDTLGAASDNNRISKAKCVVRLGGCSNSTGGKPSAEEITGYNSECRKETGYRGSITPSDEECGISPIQWPTIPPVPSEVVVHEHKPTGKWKDVQKESRTRCFSGDFDFDKKKVDCACAYLSPESVLSLAHDYEMFDMPLAQSFLDHYLKNKGKPLQVDLEDVIHRDDKVREKLAIKMQTTNKGWVKITQNDYSIQDFKYAFGAIDLLDFEVDPVSASVHLWFIDRYEFHPVGLGYKKIDDEINRDDNCVHAAAVELKSSGADDYWMFGDANVPVSLFGGPFIQHNPLHTIQQKGMLNNKVLQRR